MKKNTILKYTLFILISFTPIISFAALGGVKSLLQDFMALLVGPVEGVVFALALLYFFWGMGQFILKDAGNEKSREEGKQKMIWGIIALFVMFSIWGILRAIGSSINIPVSENTSGITTGGNTPL